jgi:hypothetical protein
VSCHRPVATLFALFALGGCSASEVGSDACASCSASSGEFEVASYHDSTRGNWYAADLDGDGKDELIAARAPEPTVVYELEGRRLQERTRLPAATWVSIGDITGDGRPDVLLGGSSFSVQRSTESGAFEALVSASKPVSGEMAGSVSVTKFPIVGRWHHRSSREPLIVKDLYHLAERSMLPTQVESFSSDARDVSSAGNAVLSTWLKLSKRFVAIDGDGDGLDELWGIDLLGQLTQLHLGAEGWAATGSWSVEDPQELLARDVNGDGAVDLVGQRSALVVTAGTDSHPGRVHQLELPELVDACTWVQLDRDHERELLCSADEQLSAYDVDFEADTLTPRLAPDLAPSKRSLVGDFDGNGVDDLVRLGGDELIVAFGVPAR